MSPGKGQETSGCCRSRLPSQAASGSVENENLSEGFYGLSANNEATEREVNACDSDRTVSAACLSQQFFFFFF